MKKEKQLLIGQIEELMVSKFKQMDDCTLELVAEFTKYKYKCKEPKNIDLGNYIRVIVRDTDDWAFIIMVNNKVSEEFTGKGLDNLLNSVINRLFKMGIKYEIIYNEYELDQSSKYEIIKRSRRGQTTGQIKTYLDKIYEDDNDDKFNWR